MIRNRWFILLLAVLLALPAVSFGEAAPTVASEKGMLVSTEEELQPEAERLSFYVRFEVTGHSEIPEKLLLDSVQRSEAFFPYEQFSIYWNEEVAGHWLCVQWNVIPHDVTLIEFDIHGQQLRKTSVPEQYDYVLELAADTKRVTFAADRQGMEVARISLYSEGALPEPFVPWQPTQGHLDYLIISTHPDDDVLFMGGVAPIYGMERGYTGTVAYVTSPGRVRIDEAMRGAWTMGVRLWPVFLGFRDISDIHQNQYRNQFLPEAVTLAIVRLLREQRPLVVFAQDVNGEYGHWQHIVVSAAVLEACKLALDETYDPASAEKFGVWEVKKCYLHLYPENPLILDVETPLASMGGKTAIQVAQEAYTKHLSQQAGRHKVQTNKDSHPLSKFGMAYGTVEAGEDAFDNIDPQLLVSAFSNN